MRLSAVVLLKGTLVQACDGIRRAAWGLPLEAGPSAGAYRHCRPGVTRRAAGAGKRAQRKGPAACAAGPSGKAPGDDLLLHGLSHTTIGAAAFHFRVRDGIGWDHSANFTRELVRVAQRADPAWGLGT